MFSKRTSKCKKCNEIYTWERILEGSTWCLECIKKYHHDCNNHIVIESGGWLNGAFCNICGKEV